MYSKLDEVLSNKFERLEFKEPDPDNMLEIEESEAIAEDINYLAQYIEKVERSAFYFFKEYEEYVGKFSVNNKEFVVGATWKDEYSRITAVMEVNTLKRLNLRKENGNTFDKAYIDLIESTKVSDQEYVKPLREIVNDRMVKLKNLKELNLEPYEITSYDIDFLMYIYDNYKFPISIDLRDGYLVVMIYAQNEEFEFVANCFYDILDYFKKL